MFDMRREHRGDSGFTIVEYAVSSAILLFVAMAVMSALSYAATATASTTKRETALALANQRLEQARNLPYDSVGTTAGNPAGTILAVEVVNSYTVTTHVDWAVAAASGLSSCKTIRITVSWTTPVAASVDIESNIAGKSTANTGDVNITVVNVAGVGIQGAMVTVTPTGGAPTTKNTDGTGFARWGNLPAGPAVITAERSGYVLDVSPLSAATVGSGQVNAWTIKEVKLGTAVVNVADRASPSTKLSDVAVTIDGPSGTLTAASVAGVATFSGLLPGAYGVTGAKVGYTANDDSFDIGTDGASYTVPFTMNNEPTVMNGTLQVTFEFRSTSFDSYTVYVYNGTRAEVVGMRYGVLKSNANSSSKITTPLLLPPGTYYVSRYSPCPSAAVYAKVAAGSTSSVTLKSNQ